MLSKTEKKLRWENPLILSKHNSTDLDWIIYSMPSFLSGLFNKTPDGYKGKSIGSSLGKLGDSLSVIADLAQDKNRGHSAHSVEFTDFQGRHRCFRVEARPFHRSYLSGSAPSQMKTESDSIAIALFFTEITADIQEESYLQYVFHGMIGKSSPMIQLYQRIKMYGQSDAPVLITGETGTGKELIARAIHDVSLRSRRPFVAVNCTALNDELFESELFGHEKGAFTGALRTHKGRFERAEGGTLFLDEIGDMSPRTQAKLLRVLEEKKYERVGGEQEFSVNVRIIAATNVSLEKILQLSQFRADLYHRLAVLRIHVPPLRDRPGDIPLLVQYFLLTLNRRYQKNVIRISPDAMRMLEEYDWPGNVREVRNVIERVYVETQGNVIGRNAFKEWEKERDYLVAGQWNLHLYETQQLTKTPIAPPFRMGSNHSAKIAWENGDRNSGRGEYYPARYYFPKALPSGAEQELEWLEGDFQVAPPKSVEITKDLLISSYHRASGNITQAARLLGIHKATFYRYLKKFNLTREKLEKIDPL